MARKTRDQRVEARRKKIEKRGFKRAAGREVRREERTERLAARKGISTDQAKRLQANRKQRFKEFASGGLENITTGRLRFRDGESSGPDAPSLSDTAATANKAFGDAGSAASAKLSADNLGMMQDELTGRGGTLYNRPGAGGTGSVEVGQHEIGPDSGFKKKTLGASGYGS